MRRFVKFFIICFILFSFNSCIRYYKSKDIIKTIEYNRNSLKNKHQKIINDYTQKLNIYNNLIKNTKTPDAPIYIKLKDSLNNVQTIVEEINKHCDKIKELQNSILNVIKNKDKIKSNDKQWNKLIKYNDLYIKIGENISILFKKYAFFSNEYNNLLLDHKIRLLNKNSLKNKVYPRIKNYKKRLDKISKMISNYENHLIKNKSNLTSEEFKNKINILNKIKNLIIKMKKLTMDIEDKFKLLKLEFNKKENIYVGPGMISYSILNHIENYVENMKKLTNEFENLKSNL